VAGFRILTYDLYGRGYSDAPHILDSPSLHSTQLALLLQYLGWNSPGACIVGLSMGGSIAAMFAAQYPWLVDGKVVFLASVGTFPDNHFPRIMGVMTSGAFQTLLAIQPFKRVPLPARKKVDAIAQLFSLQSAVLPRYGRAISTSIRQGPLRGAEESFRIVGTSDLHVLLVHGTADKSVPYVPFLDPILKGLLPGATVVTLPDVGHELTVTHPDEVARALIEFLG